MKKAVKERLDTLGTFRSRIVGVQYYKAVCEAGERLHFDRNPYNEYDENAIEVCGGKGVLGHLKRGQAAWLAPLMDRGWIFLKGRALDAGDKWMVPVEVEVLATPKGRRLTRPRKEESAADVVHNHLLDVYKRSESYSSGVVRGIREFYRPVVDLEGILPETRLVFKLLKDRMRANRARRLRGFLADADAFFGSLRYGRTIKYGDLMVLPLVGGDDGECWCVSGGRALDDGTLLVEEVGEDGVVSRLRATNRGEKPVMLISGEGLKGAKQDRIVNVTVVVEAGETVDIPVSCVERGRWSYRGDPDFSRFEAAGFATHSIRSTLRKDINRKAGVDYGRFRFDGDQDMVWHSVDMCSRALLVDSPTESLNDVREAGARGLEQALSKIKYPEKTVGFAAFNEGGQVSVELFRHRDMMRDNWNALLESLVIDSEIERRRGAASVSSTMKFGREDMKGVVKEFFDNVIAAAGEPEASPGRGEYVAASRGAVDAGILCVAEKLEHLSGTMSLENI